VASKLIQVKVSGLMCSFCTMSVEKGLGRLAGVRNVQVNLVHGIVLVEADPDEISDRAVAERIEALGYTVVATEAQQFETDEALFATIKRRGFLAMGMAVADLLIDPIDVFGLAPGTRALISGVVAAVVLLWVGAPILRKTLKAIGQRVINANVLLSTGAWGAFGIGVAHLVTAGSSVAPSPWPNFFPVAIWLMALHLCFGYFKLGTRKRAAGSVRRLLALQAEVASVVRGGREVEVAVAEVAPGETIVIRPGERVPLDGVIREGASSFDLSSITGESAPAYLEAGGEVVGGTMNLDGVVRVEVTRLASEGYVAQVVRLMRQIEEKKPPIQLLMDRLMNYYGPVVYAVAAVAFAGWFLASGNLQQATLIGLTTIIMGYPCALGITTPMVLAIGGGHGIARGLLVRAGEFFQALAGIDTVVWDKTGTLTYGRPTVREVALYGAEQRDVLGLIAGAEAGSEHPLAGAIVRYAEFQDVRVPAATDFHALPGRGVVAAVEGRRVVVGRRNLLEQEGVAITPEALARAAALEAAHTVVYAAADGKLLALVALQDLPRPGAAAVMDRLHALGIRTVLLTGDNRAVADAVAAEIGIREVHAEVLPDQKAAVIAGLQAEGRQVAMVGDGINDGPALMQSDCGIALGAGTDVAMESAGVVLVSDRLEKVVSAIVLGRASHRKMQQNIGIAVFANIVGVTLAILGLITAPVAIGIMTASVLAVLISTLGLIRLDLGSTVTASPQGGAEALPAAANVVETVIPARRIRCRSCTNRIEEHFREVPGVRKVAADVGRKEVLLAYEPARVTEDTLRGQLEELGYR
jgi:heavy metal translocating P-type ATPase